MECSKPNIFWLEFPFFFFAFTNFFQVNCVYDKRKSKIYGTSFISVKHFIAEENRRKKRILCCEYEVSLRKCVVDQKKNGCEQNEYFDVYENREVSLISIFLLMKLHWNNFGD